MTAEIHLHDEEVLLRPQRGPRDPRIPSTGLLLISPTDTKQASTQLHAQGAISHPLYNSNLYLHEIPAGRSCSIPGACDTTSIRTADKKTGYFVTGPAVGAPMAVMTLEKLIALGARTVIVYSCCGALRDSLQGGDLFLPTWALPEEGTSPHYGPAETCRASEGLLALLGRHFEAAGQSYASGPIWTTDAPYRETRAKVADFAGRGILAVDMEFSALCAVARFRGIDLAAVMLVSDELWRPAWAPFFSNSSFKKKNRHLLASMMELAASLGIGS